MRKALIPLLALSLIALPVAAQSKREIGNLVYDGAPETPAALKAAIAPYYNARSAVFEDWLPDGSMLIATRFGEAQQIHHVKAPGAARTQLTFFNEPINTAQAVPGTQTYLYPRDVGGAEYYQAYVRDLKGAVHQNTVDIRELKDAVHQNTVDIRDLKDAVHQHTVDIRDLRSDLRENSLSLQQRGVEIRSLGEKVERVIQLEERVAALEKPPA